MRCASLCVELSIKIVSCPLYVIAQLVRCRAKEPKNTGGKAEAKAFIREIGEISTFLEHERCCRNWFIKITPVFPPSVAHLCFSPIVKYILIYDAIVTICISKRNIKYIISNISDSCK